MKVQNIVGVNQKMIEGQKKPSRKADVLDVNPVRRLARAAKTLAVPAGSIFHLKVPVRGAFAPPSRPCTPVKNRYDGAESTGVHSGYEPRYTLTEKMSKLLSKIDISRGFLLGAHLSPQWIRSMQNEALVKEAHHTTHIEGTALTLTQSAFVLSGNQLNSGYDSDVQELRNYKLAFDLVSTYLSSGAPITEVMIREIHARLVAGVRGDTARPGEYRTIQNYVVNSKTGAKIYEPPSADNIPLLMAELVHWIRQPKAVHPVLVAGIAHFQLVHIHPFLDGNGRASRLLATLILYSHGYDFRRLFSMSEFYDLDRSAYYEALQTVREHDMDLTEWLEYYLNGLSFQMSKVQDLGKKSMRASALAQHHHLSERQQNICELILSKEMVSISDCEECITTGSRRSIQRDLRQLLNKGVIESDLNGPTKSYRLSAQALAL